jgi:ATP-binding cassette subfamily B protein
VLVLLPLTFAMNWRMALLVTALLLVFVVLTVLTVWRTERAQARVEGYHSDLAERAGDALGNLSVIQTFSRAGDEVAALESRMRDVIRAQFPVLRLWALFSVLTGAASTITVVLLFLAGTWLHLRGEATLGEVVAFIGIATQLVGRLEQLASFFNRMLFQAPALAEFFGVLDERPPNAARETAAARRVGRLRGHVRYEDVSFSYDGRREAIHALDLDVPAGRTVALVGSTGAGKSTALALLCRLWDPQRGRILVDGIDIRELSLDSLRDNIAVVLQDATLFRRTIAENLRVGRPDASDADLVRAATLACAHDFIMAQPQGYDTVLGERGRTLSGGERQRLAIARAILKDAPILVLDEATSALDNRTEALVQQALAALTRGRTTFVIAHRLSTVRHADLVLVMEGGRVIESGPYDALLARGGALAALARGQAPELLSMPPE